MNGLRRFAVDRARDRPRLASQLPTPTPYIRLAATRNPKAFTGYNAAFPIGDANTRLRSLVRLLQFLVLFFTQTQMGGVVAHICLAERH